MSRRANSPPDATAEREVPARHYSLKSRNIAEVVQATDQFEAYDSLKERPAEDFGLVVTAQSRESVAPVAVRTSLLMRRWGRNDDAHTFAMLAVANGFRDTTEADSAGIDPGVLEDARIRRETGMGDWVDPVEVRLIEATNKKLVTALSEIYCILINQQCHAGMNAFKVADDALDQETKDKLIAGMISDE